MLEERLLFGRVAEAQPDAGKEPVQDFVSARARWLLAAMFARMRGDVKEDRKLQQACRL